MKPEKRKRKRKAKREFLKRQDWLHKLQKETGLTLDELVKKGYIEKEKL